MDSSLNWDSMVFKELSLFMSILSEDLIANEFPRELIDKPKDILSTIQTELQVCNYSRNQVFLISLLVAFQFVCHQNGYNESKHINLYVKQLDILNCFLEIIPA